LDRLVSGWILLFLYVSDCQITVMDNHAYTEWCWKMGEKEGTNVGTFVGKVAPATNNLAGGAMKISSADGIIVKCHDETRGCV
jgi:hypothetical protein